MALPKRDSTVRVTSGGLIGIPLTDWRLKVAFTTSVCGAFAGEGFGLTRLHAPEKSGLSCDVVAATAREMRRHDERTFRMRTSSFSPGQTPRLCGKFLPAA